VGSAVNAAVAAGFYSDVTEAAEQMIKLGEAIDPIPETHRFYQEYLQHYVGTYEALHERMHAVALACERSRQSLSGNPAVNCCWRQ
jgi:ribulose kinase